MEEKIAAGAFGGIVGGVFSGFILQSHWLASPTALFYGEHGVQSSWTNHLATCLIFGMFFGAIAGIWSTKLTGRVISGVAAGFLLWITSQRFDLGPTTPGIWGIIGYLILGAMTGLGFHLALKRRLT